MRYNCPFCVDGVFWIGWCGGCMELWTGSRLRDCEVLHLSTQGFEMVW